MAYINIYVRSGEENELTTVLVSEDRRMLFYEYHLDYCWKYLCKRRDINHKTVS